MCIYTYRSEKHEVANNTRWLSCTAMLESRMMGAFMWFMCVGMCAYMQLCVCMFACVLYMCICFYFYWRACRAIDTTVLGHSSQRALQLRIAEQSSELLGAA